MKNLLYNFFNLHRGEDDKSKTLESVKSNISFSGANLWILVCAILVASVGLNVNSTAVVIGAMLISPLMGPIVGAGFALGIYDFSLLKRSLRNLLIATVASLIVSTLYFFLSPFKDAQSELLARTSPNIYDILIAFFGGLVGVIAVTRVEKGNPIPGVAIATALMPPLCTAGFGLGTGNFKFFFGALFLYTINCVFICIATFAIVKYLKYPSVTVDEKHRNRVKYGITGLVILMIVPSGYFAYSLFNQQKFSHDVDIFIETEFTEKGNTVVYKKTNYSKSPKSITLAFLSKRFSDEELDTLNSKLNQYGLNNTRLFIKQDSTTNIQLLKKDILNEIQQNQMEFNEKDAEIQMLENQIAENSFDNEQIFKESQALFPGILTLSLGNHIFPISNDSTFKTTVLIYQSKSKLSPQDELKLTKWISQRLNLSNVEIYHK